MTLLDRDSHDVEALLTDLYLESLMAHARNDGDLADARLDPALREASRRLRSDLVRVHPSFRFEERLAARLAEAATAMRLPAAAGDGGVAPPAPTSLRSHADGFDPLTADDPEAARDLARPILIGGALTSAALSIAGAALVAWRRTRPGSPMARAARAAHGQRATIRPGLD